MSDADMDQARDELAACEQKICDLQEQIDVYKKALEKIRDQDYRGNRCSCSHIAYEALINTK